MKTPNNPDVNKLPATPAALAPVSGPAAPICPKCGKPMIEEPVWKGLWLCVDYRRPINDHPPFRFKCTGSIATEKAAGEFFQELERLYVERN